MRHLMSPLDLSAEELDDLLTLANDIERNPSKYAHACEGKKLATCFYEPSTRTRLSFEAAMLNPKERVFLTPSALFPATQISVPYVTPKKVRLLLLLQNLPFP